MAKTYDPTGDAAADTVTNADYGFANEPLSTDDAMDYQDTYGVRGNYRNNPIAGRRDRRERDLGRQVHRGMFNFDPSGGEASVGSPSDLNNYLYGNQGPEIPPLY